MVATACVYRGNYPNDLFLLFRWSVLQCIGTIFLLSLGLPLRKIDEWYGKHENQGFTAT